MFKKLKIITSILLGTGVLTTTPVRCVEPSAHPTAPETRKTESEFETPEQ